MNLLRREHVSRVFMLIPLAALLVLVAVASFTVHRAKLVGTQIANLELFKQYSRAIEKYKQEMKVYPAELIDLSPGDLPERGRNIPLDSWRHPLHYERKNDGYLLVSFGRDGYPDGPDYWQVRARSGPETRVRDICFKWDADQVMSDRGFLSACSK